MEYDKEVRSYAEEEAAAFSGHINSLFANVKILRRHLPVHSSDICEKLSDGLILFRLINAVEHGTISPKTMHRTEMLSDEQKLQNLQTVLKGAEDIGCDVTRINTDEILRAYFHPIMDFLWQLIKKQVFGKVSKSISECPNAQKLLHPGENGNILAILTEEQILLRWMNFHLLRAGKTDRYSYAQVKDFDSDLMDPYTFGVILHQLSPDTCDLPSGDVDMVKLARTVVENAEKLGVPVALQPLDMCGRFERLNKCFAAQIFDTINGLDKTIDVEIEQEVSEEVQDVEPEQPGSGTSLVTVSIDNVGSAGDQPVCGKGIEHSPIDSPKAESVHQSRPRLHSLVTKDSPENQQSADEYVPDDCVPDKYVPDECAPGECEHVANMPTAASIADKDANSNHSDAVDAGSEMSSKSLVDTSDMSSPPTSCIQSVSLMKHEREDVHGAKTSESEARMTVTLELAEPAFGEAKCFSMDTYTE
jgi:hypothetical protein